MTSEEQRLLQDLLQRLGATRGAAKDPQAEALLRQAMAELPDASYWLAQRTLVLEQALQQAQQQIAQLQQAAQANTGARTDGGGFLSGGLGTQFGRNPEPQGWPQDGYAQQPRQAAPGWRERWFGGGAAQAPAAPQAGYAPAGGSGFLGNAAAAAAGVAGGMFLFNGLENLLGGHHGNATGLFNGGQPEVRENITQNFFGDSDGGAGRDQLASDAGLERIDGSGFDDDGGGFFDDDSFA